MPYGSRRNIPVETKRQMVILSANHSATAIAKVLHVSARTVRRVTRLARMTGNVTTANYPTGRPRMLSSLDLAVSMLVDLQWCCADARSFWRAASSELQMLIFVNCRKSWRRSVEYEWTLQLSALRFGEGDSHVRRCVSFSSARTCIQSTTSRSRDQL